MPDANASKDSSGAGTWTTRDTVETWLAIIGALIGIGIMQYHSPLSWQAWVGIAVSSLFYMGLLSFVVYMGKKKEQL